MRALIAAMKLSLDGKYQGPDGMADWAHAWSEDYGITPEIDACLVGGGMYPGYENYWSGIMANPQIPAWITGTPPTPAEREWAQFAKVTPHHVLSTSLTTAAWPNTSFLRNLDDVRALKAKPGKSIYLMGGGHVTTELIEHGLVDEIRLILHPLIAGQGDTLFTMPTRHPLALRAVSELGDGLVRLTYSIV